MNTKRRGVMEDRFTIRIARPLARELDALGKFERRRVPEMVRTCLAKALGEIRAARQKKLDTSKPLTNDQLLERLFPPEHRPSVRTLARWRKKRIVPHYKIGNRVWFDEATVRDKLAKKNLIRAI